MEQNSVTIYGILERNQFVTVYFDFALISRFQLLGEKIILRKLPSHCTYDSLRHSFFEAPLITLCQQNLAISDSDVQDHL